MPRGIDNALVQSTGTGFLHACDVQALTDDDLIPVDQFPAGCVGKVGPAVGDPLVEVLHHTLGFAKGTSVSKTSRLWLYNAAFSSDRRLHVICQTLTRAVLAGYMSSLPEIPNLSE